MSKHLITILGPTASGKTSLSIALAQHYNTAILSSDSRQFYQEMSIGTAKPTPTELNAAKHHFIDTLSVDDPYSAGQYEDEALAILNDLYQKNDKAILVGGSGLYINAVLFGIDPFPDIPKETRLQVMTMYKNEGIQALRDELRKHDPQFFLEVDLDNPRRLMRAIEVCLATGEPYSTFRNASPKKRNFKPINIAYAWERETLYERINQRVDNMLADGLIEECIKLEQKKHLPALDTIGYKEIFGHFDKQYDLEEAARLIKRNSRRYAKRQMTWFKNIPDIQWLNPKMPIEEITEFLDKKMSEC